MATLENAEKAKEERSFLGKAWDIAKGSPVKATLLSGLLLGGAYEGWHAVNATHGPRHIAHYMIQNTVADLGYIVTADFSNSRAPATRVLICQPAHYNPDTHQEVAPPPHLATLYSQMEQNLVQQIENRQGYLYNDIHIALRNNRHPVAIFHKNPITHTYDYSTKILGMDGPEHQDCSKLTPRQTEGIVSRERGSISTRHFNF